MRIPLLIFIITISINAFAQPKPGTVFPEGKPGVDYNLKDTKGKRHGVWVQQWKDTRNLLYKGQYEHGVPTGNWERYYPDGAKSADMTHVKDTTVIDATFYHPDGQSKASQGQFLKKKKEGLWKIWNEAGTVIAEENYKDSLLNGACKYFYPAGGLLKIETYKNGVKEGAFTEYYENGKKRAEGTYLNDEKNGAYKAWFEKGNLDCEGKYNKGLQDGTWYFSHEDGKPKVTVVFKNGVETKRRYENGTFKDYYDSGIPKSEYSYENGKKEGPFTEWYDKGQYESVPASKEDQETGIVYREELRGTQIKFHGDYMNDQLEGEVIYYRENGSVEKIEEWSDGKLVRTRAAAK